MDRNLPAPAQIGGPLGGIVPEDADDAARPRPVSLQDLDRRGLACPVRAEEPEDLAARDLEVDATDRLVGAVRLVKISHEDRRGVHRS